MSESDTPSRERKVTAAQLGRRLLRLLTPARVKSLSLHDAEGELLWLSQGEYGAVQRRLVQDAQDAFALEGSAQHLERDTEHGERALFFCERTPTGERCGMAFAIVSGRVTSSSTKCASAPPAFSFAAAASPNAALRAPTSTVTPSVPS